MEPSYNTIPTFFFFTKLPLNSAARDLASTHDTAVATTHVTPGAKLRCRTVARAPCARFTAVLDKNTCTDGRLFSLHSVPPLQIIRDFQRSLPSA